MPNYFNILDTPPPGLSFDPDSVVYVDPVNFRLGVHEPTPEGTLHVTTASAGAVVAAADADDGIFENSNDGGISLITPDLNYASIKFASPTDNAYSEIHANQAADIFEIITAGGAQLTLFSGIPYLYTINGFQFISAIGPAGPTFTSAVSGAGMQQKGEALNPNFWIGGFETYWAANPIAAVKGVTGTDTVNQDDGVIIFQTSPDAGTGLQTYVLINQVGTLAVGVQPELWLSTWPNIRVGAKAAFHFGGAQGGHTYLSHNEYYDGTVRFLSAAAASQIDLHNTISFRVSDAAGVIGDPITWNTLLQLNSTYIVANYPIEIGIGTAAPAAQLYVRNASIAQTVIKVQQDVNSSEFITLIGSGAAGDLTQNIVKEADVTTATRAGFLKLFVQDNGNQITDQAYFIPIYTLA